MYCEKCGSQIENGLNFCPECGAPVAKVNSAASVAPAAAAAVTETVASTAVPTETVAPSYTEPTPAAQTSYQQPANTAYQQPNYQQPSYQQPTYQQASYQANYSTPMSEGEAGRSPAKSALILGIIGLVLDFTTYFSIVGLILGIIGLVKASASKKAGFKGGLRGAGFGLSLAAVILGGIIVAAFGLVIVSAVLEEL